MKHVSEVKIKASSDLMKIIEELSKDLEIYTEQVSEDIKNAVDRCTLEMEKDIERNSPVGKTGKYQAGWYRFSYQEYKSPKRIGIVKNKTRGSLVHLMEFGHKARNYDENHIMVAPSPLKGHVKPAKQRAMERLDKEIKSILNYTK